MRKSNRHRSLEGATERLGEGRPHRALGHIAKDQTTGEPGDIEAQVRQGF
ncbi:hypothetical protein [Ensifer adhaerens]|nr:hypothetical protein [Ensifer adhaerens]